MSYRVEFAPSAAREFRRMDRQLQVRLKTRIDALAENPRPHGAKQLAGLKGLYRVREGDYRIVYQVQDEVLLVLVVGVGHRREVYRKLLE